MGRCVKHIRCPACEEKGKDRKGNNLGVYDDGTTYCFSCGFRSRDMSMAIRNDGFVPKARKKQKAVNNTAVLPDDVDTVYPIVALDWIKQYDLTMEDLYANRCLWSNLYSRLIFPYFQDSGNTLLGWQGRYFGKEDKAKWFSRGNLDSIYHIFNREQSRDLLVVVEDVVSAIKIGKAGFPVMPLFGSYISSNKIQELKLLTNRLLIWLDPDKRKESVMFSGAANTMDLPSSAVFSSKDPKELPMEYIKEKLNEAKLGG